MALAYVTFINYYPYAAEEQAIEKAREQYETYKQRPIADISYDAVDVEF